MQHGLKDFAAQMRNHKEIRFLATPANALYSFARVLTQDAQAAHRPRTPVATDARLGERWNGQTRPVLFILVVGETARAANWGLNGGSAHDTTPQLARLDVINFPAVSSCGTNTEVSVPCMFSAHGRRNYDEEAIRGCESLLHVLQRAGRPISHDHLFHSMLGLLDVHTEAHDRTHDFAADCRA